MTAKTFEWRNKSVLVTGGTGSFGRKFIEAVLKRQPRRVVVFSRDELKQHEMRQQFSDEGDSVVRYFIGDVRDGARLRRAFEGIDVVVHAAALKQVPACEYNPLEAIKTNIDGARNVVDAAIDAKVDRVMALSTDKAVSPVNLYGATKLVAEKLFVQANAYSGGHGPIFSCVRYGNVVGSRGSVVPLFRQQRETGTVTLTDERMTRFWITLDQGVNFVLTCTEEMAGGEVFVPKIASMRMVDLARLLAPGCKVAVTGIRPGEKLHEVLVSEDEARSARDVEGKYVIEPLHPWWNNPRWSHGTRPADGFRYASDNNPEWLTDDQLRDMVGEPK